MLFERFEAPGLAHYSYAVGCPAAGRVAIVDPKRDFDTYVEFARSRRVAISHVLETHIHADYASGAAALAAATGATLCVSRYDAGETYVAAFDHPDWARRGLRTARLSDGETIEIGSVRIQALHTPGHTPEHVSYLVFDASRSADVPMLMLSGDFLFVGSLGRPDLLGEEAKRGLAERLFDSVRDVLAKLPDGLEVHPAHGAGSMCGSGMSGRPTSTLGFERAANPYLDPRLTREHFVERILGTVPPFPPYYRRMKKVNAAGAAAVDPSAGREAIPPGRFRELVAAGHVVIDLRGQLPFGDGHVPGAFGIGLGASLSTWAAWVVPYDTPILLVADEPGLGEAADRNRGQIEQAVRSLMRVGLDDVRGHLAGGMDAWRAAEMPTRTTPQIAPAELAARLRRGDGPQVLDVRSDAEFAAGHVEGAIHIPGGELADRLAAGGRQPRAAAPHDVAGGRQPGAAAPHDELLGGGPVAVICGSGYRSTVAASVLERAGFADVFNVTGGMQAWQAAGLAVTRA